MSQLYKFSHNEDRNDLEELQKALGGSQLRKPETFGGSLQDPNKNTIHFDSFTTHTPPDVTPNTMIVAVLGITQDTASPEEDGWFLSDFAAFHYLLRRFTKTQIWYHCLDLNALIETHTRYLHGNPFLDRKVVLDKEILASAQDDRAGQPLTRILDPNNLKNAFKKAIKEQCDQAAKANPPENVLVLMFGYGEADHKGMYIGGGKQSLLRREHFASAFKESPALITLLTTHCYSGGWTCWPDLNISTMAAAGESKRSRSWSKTGSSGRACGSIFTTAMIDKLVYSSATGRGITDPRNSDNEEEELTDQQEESYAELTEAVYENLLRGIDRRGMEHKITFGAQDDAWSMVWRQRTGYPLESYSTRWQSLPDWPKGTLIQASDCCFCVVCRGATHMSFFT